MPGPTADLCINARWVLPMNARGAILENHSLIVRDGRIADVLPKQDAARRPRALAVIDRPRHVLLPGLINAHSQDATLQSIAAMIKGGVTAFCAAGGRPDDSARLALAQGLRIVIGLPVSERPSPWAKNTGDYVTRALGLRDEFRGHPAVTTLFALPTAAKLGDATFHRIATLADELDAGIVMPLHESLPAIDASMAQHGMRPLERLQTLGLLTPALTAVHLLHLQEPDLALAQRSGIAGIVCPALDLRDTRHIAPVAAWRHAGLRLGVGSRNAWADLNLLALLPSTASAPGTTWDAWDALTAVTTGGACALGIDGEVGTLESGKWADLCCIDLGGPATTPPHDPLDQLVFAGGCDLVSDVWVAGCRLLEQGEFTRLDWPELAARLWETAS